MLRYYPPLARFTPKLFGFSSTNGHGYNTLVVDIRNRSLAYSFICIGEGGVKRTKQSDQPEPGISVDKPISAGDLSCRPITGQDL